MKSIIVGTAGHIDHGKTALVKALTGIDADRLQEEKRRGITIDIGFAHLDIDAAGGTLRVGFVDVPGHERFVRNMLAGVGGIDIVLLIIAADESIKPQTREHFDICRLLNVQHGITVITKSDLVDRDTLEVVRLEIEDFVRGSFLDAQRSLIIPVSSLNGEGLAELKSALVRVATQVPGRDSSAFPRLPIDRVFTMKGFGTVITGTLISGTIKKEQELEILPTGRRVRVRGVQVHGQAAEKAVAGQRTALNIAGVSTEDLQRGMMAIQPAGFNATNRVDVSLTLLPSAKALKNGARVHLHAYTSETVVTITLHHAKTLEPGQSALARLRLADPLPLLPGDRFVLRQFSPLVTIGGGVVLDASPIPKLKPEAVPHLLEVSLAGDAQQIITARIARRWQRGLLMDQATAETGWRREEIEKHLAGLLASGVVVRTGDLLLYSATVAALKMAFVSAVSEFHKTDPLLPGIGKENLREKLALTPEVFALVLGSLLQEKKLQQVGESIGLSGRGVVMKDEEAESKKIIEYAFASAGLKVPALKEVLAGLKVDKNRAQKIVTLLLRDKTLVKISDDLVFHRDALMDLRTRVTGEKSRSSKMDVARFKDLTGVSRKYAIPLLEYLDRERVTRRVGDGRVIL
jgi:selenocysteine-specific elongation factor